MLNCRVIDMEGSAMSNTRPFQCPRVRALRRIKVVVIGCVTRERQKRPLDDQRRGVVFPC